MLSIWFSRGRASLSKEYIAAFITCYIIRFQAPHGPLRMVNCTMPVLGTSFVAVAVVVVVVVVAAIFIIKSDIEFPLVLITLYESLFC